MVVIEISSNHAPELALVQSNDMIEAVASQGSDESLHEWVRLYRQLHLMVAVP